MIKDIQTLLSRLSLAFGPTGCEEPVADIIREEGGRLCQAVTTDRSGNVIFSYDPSQADEHTQTVMIAARMDEVGFMIHEIDDEGYLRFSVLGDVDPRVLCGRNVRVGNENRQIQGVIASKAIHHQTAEERAKITEPENMYIDIGATSREDAEKKVSVGDFGTFDGLFDSFGADQGFIRAKALDGRVGCAVALEVMKRLNDETLISPHRLRFCFTVRGETGPSGAGLAAATVCPDSAIVLDSAIAADLPEIADAFHSTELAAGCAVPFADKKTVYDKQLTELTLAKAKERGIAVQIKRGLCGGNGAADIQKRGRGAKVLCLSVPIRYSRTASTVIARSDVDAAVQMLSALVETPFPNHDSL